ncbi:MAG: DNA repair protein RecO, partial [Cetobacterium sp.]
MEIISDEGIVLRKKDYGDSDRLITIFSKNNGKISFYLKGIRKSKKRDKEAVELFSLSTFYFSKKQEKYILNDFEILDYNLNLKLNM